MEEKKKSKKTIIIVAVVIAIIILLVGGYYIYQNYEQNKTVGAEWGDKYHMYLKTAVADTQADRNEKYGMPNNMEDTKIQFIETTKNEPPKMAMTYKLDGKEYTNVYYIEDNGEIGYMAYKQPSTLEFLYNIELEQYMWYVHIKDGSNHSYKAVDSKTQEQATEDTQNTATNETTTTTQNTAVNETASTIENTTTENVATNETNTTRDNTATKVEENAEYTFTEEEMKTGDDTQVAEGEIPTLSKFEETFVVPEVEENKTSIDLNSNVEDKALMEVVKAAVESYKPEEKIVTEEVKTKTEESVTKLETKKEEIKKAEEEKKKKEEEEAARKAAEEAAKGLKVGNNIVKYGTYKGIGAAEGETLIIKSDGTATLKTSYFTDNYVYSVGKYNFSQDETPSYEDAIIFRKPGAGSADAMALYVYDGKLCQDPSAYVYVGD